MDRYRRAYRDANSPLTPLTPLSTNFFDFNCNATESCDLSVRKSEIPRTRRRTNSSTENSWFSAPKSCDSGLKQQNSKNNNNYIKVIQKLGSEGTTTPIPPARYKRILKREMDIPEIKLEPPPRAKRCRNQEYENFGEFIENTQCLSPRRSFDLKNIRKSSPIEPKPMSPRFGEFLTRWGINCLKSIFERQEIDLQTFCCLNADDLQLLGIQDPVYRERVVEAINYLCSSNKGNGYKLGIK